MPPPNTTASSVALHFPNYNASLQASLAAAVDAHSAFYASTDREKLIQLFARLQRPKRCSTARFLVLEDFEDQTGMGMSFHFLHCMLLQSLWEGRTLVFSSSVVPGLRGKWRWCSEGSSDWSCYFEPWSPCEGYFSRRHFKPDIKSGPFTPWAATSQNLDKRIVVFWQARDKSRQMMARIYKTWDDPLRYHPPRMGRSWWFSITFSVLLRMTPFVERAAVKFLHEEGVKHGERLAVAFVRYGAKKHEESLISFHEYEQPLLRALAPNCSDTRHVLIVTESPQAIADMTAMCNAHGWHCFYTNQTRIRPDAFESDIWNPRGYHAHSSRQPTDVLGHYGWHSVLNLAIAQRATYMVGSMGSLWMRMSTVFAHRFHGEPISVCSLRWVNYRTTRWNPLQYAELCSERCAKQPPACSRHAWSAEGEW